MPEFHEGDYVSLPVCFPEFTEAGHVALVCDTCLDTEEYVLLLDPELRWEDDVPDDQLMRWPFAQRGLLACGSQRHVIPVTVRLNVTVETDCHSRQSFDRLLRRPATLSSIERAVKNAVESHDFYGDDCVAGGDLVEYDGALYVIEASDVLAEISPNDPVRRQHGVS